MKLIVPSDRGPCTKRQGWLWNTSLTHPVVLFLTKFQHERVFFS